MKTNLQFYFSLILLAFFWTNTNAYTVKGTVLDSESGKPVPNVMIEFQKDSTDYGWIEPVYTGQDGTYKIELKEGIYYILVYNENYQSYEEKVHVVSDMVLDFKLIPITILPAFNNSISGVVVDGNTNQAVPYASVSLNPVYTDPPVFNYYSDENGKFSITNISPGIYSLSAWQNGYEYYFDTTKINVEDSTKIEGISILLKPIKTYNHIEFQVFSVDVNDNRVPIPRVEVYIYGNDQQYYSITDENGEFILDKAAGGVYYCYLNLEGWTQKTSQFEVNQDNQVIKIEMEKLRLGIMKGTVLNDADSKPLMGAYVNVYPVDSKFGGMINYAAVSDSNGHYSILLPEGKYIVSCSYINYYNFYNSVTEYFDNAKTYEEAAPVTAAEDSTSIINFGLDITKPEIVDAKITGKIISSDGTLIKYAALTLSDNTYSRYEELKAEPDAQGNYSVPVKLLKGHNELVVGAYSDGFEQQFYNGKSSWYEADVISFDASESNNVISNIDFTLTPYQLYGNYSISGMVTDENHNPVLGAYVEAYGENGSIGYSITDSSGYYILPNLMEGKYIIGFSAEGYIPEYFDNALQWENAQAVAVIADVKDINAELEKSLEPGFAGVITGRVSFGNNSPAAGARVILSTVDNVPVTADVTDADGKFTLKGIKEDDYNITISMVNCPSYSSNLNFSTKESSSFDYNVILTLTNVKNSGKKIPDKFSLDQNYPNPFNPSTTISYYLKEEGYSKLIIYNSLGQIVRTLDEGLRQAGSYKINFNASQLPSGIYFYRLTVKNSSGNNTFDNVKKLMLLK